MKRLVVVVMITAVALMVGSAHAEKRYPLGFGNVALKVDYLRFTDSEVDDLDLANAPYIGVEFFFPVWSPNFYLGLESGYAWSSGEPFGGVDLDLDYVPIELNAKYVFEINPCWTFDLGGGISYNYLNIDVSGLFRGSEDDWLFGGQFFADLNYKTGPWFFGTNIKYQLTEDIDDVDVSANNFRVGGQFGFMF